MPTNLVGCTISGTMVVVAATSSVRRLSLSASLFYFYYPCFLISLDLPAAQFLDSPHVRMDTVPVDGHTPLPL